MRVIFCPVFILSVFICLSSPCLSNASAAPSDAIKKAAQEGMKSFFKGDRLEHLRSQGFNSKEDLEKVELGEGFEIFTIPAEKIMDESASQDLQSLVSTTNQWNFLVFVDGEVKTIVKVDLIDGKWTPIGYGSPEFAKIMANFFNIWPASSGYRWRYVRVYQANESFTEVYLRDELLGIVPSSTLMSYKTGKPLKEYDPHNLINPDGIASTLRPALKRNIEEWKPVNERKEQQ